jgi:Ca-activated chloride channel family protein
VKLNFANGLKSIFILCLSSVLVSPLAEAKLAELLVLDDKGFKPLEMTEAKVTYDINLTTARATYDLVFTNNKEGALEGTFYFALPKGSYVHKFGMYVDGHYQSAAVVEAAAGRAAYEAMVRRGIDPALVEWTAGNTFKMRVFPIIKGKPTRIVMTIGMPLTMVNKTLSVELPLDFGKLEKLTLDVEGQVYGSALPQIVGLKGLGLKKEKTIGSGNSQTTSFVGSYSENDILPPMNVEFKSMGVQDTQVRIRREDSDKDRFFEAHGFVSLPSEKRQAPATASIFWDFSLSSEKEAERQLEVLELYLATRKPKKVDIWGFHQQVFPVAAQLDGSAIKKIVEVVRSKPYDGGTRIDRLMAQIAVTTKKNENIASDIVIFSDGVDSFELFDFKKPKNLTHKNLNAFLIAPSVGANQSLLQLIAESLDAVVLWQDSELSDTAFTDEPWIVKKVEGSSGLAKLQAGTGSTLFPGDGLVVRGQIKKDGKASVTFSLAQKTKKKTVNWEFDTKDADTSKTSVVPRLWAQEQILALTAEKRSNAGEIKALALSHQLASPYTVMVVLEWCDDYAQYKLPAPKDCRERPASSQSWSNFDDEELSEDEGSSAEEANDGVVSDGAAKGGESFEAADIGGQRLAPLGEPLPPPAAAPESKKSAPIPAEPDSVLDEEVALDIAEEYESSADYAEESLPSETPVLDIGFEAKLTEASKKSADALYAQYLKSRPLYEKIPFYFVFTADLLTKSKRLDLAELVLANVVEIRPGEARWLRIYAYKLISWGKAGEAVAIYKAVSELREEDPQSFRDFGLALEAVGQHVLALSMFEKVYKGKWDERLVGMKKIIQNDLARAARKTLAASGKKTANDPNTKKLQTYAALDKKTADSIVVTLSWDTDMTDIDLHVIEPNNAHVYYSDPEPKNAFGKLSWDTTDGYGPEQYRSFSPMKGAHKVMLTYFSRNPVATSDGTFARVDIAVTKDGITQEQTKTLFLKDGREVRSVIEINFDGKNARPAPLDFKKSIGQVKDLLNKSQVTLAIKEVDKIGVRADPSEEGLRLFTKARILVRLKRFQEAETANQRAVALDPELIEAHYNNACIAALTKNPAKAESHLQLLIDSVARDNHRAEKFLRLMDKDPDLASIRATVMFKKMRNQLKMAH